MIKDLLNKYGAKPNKTLGQNFLTDKNILEKIIKSADLKKTDTVLEVGPGIGTLTQELAKNAGYVIAIEKDKTMCKILQETLAEFNNVKIIHGDILKIKKLEKFKNYKVVANIPYYLTSHLIREFLEAEQQPEFMVLMVQKEVAQRICSKPPDMSLLSVSVQFYADPKIISYVSKNCFWPSPKVDSAIIKIIPKFVGCPTSHKLFFKIAKAGFSHPRKQILGNLAGALKLDKNFVETWLQKNNINPAQRAETLSIEDWQNLASTIEK